MSHWIRPTVLLLEPIGAQTDARYESRRSEPLVFQPYGYGASAPSIPF